MIDADDIHQERLTRVRPIRIVPNHYYPDLLDVVQDVTPNASTSWMVNRHELRELIRVAMLELVGDDRRLLAEAVASKASGHPYASAPSTVVTVLDALDAVLSDAESR